MNFASVWEPFGQDLCQVHWGQSTPCQRPGTRAADPMPRHSEGCSPLARSMQGRNYAWHGLCRVRNGGWTPHANELARGLNPPCQCMLGAGHPGRWGLEPPDAFEAGTGIAAFTQAFTQAAYPGLPRPRHPTLHTRYDLRVMVWNHPQQNTKGQT